MVLCGRGEALHCCQYFHVTALRGVQYLMHLVHGITQRLDVSYTSAASKRQQLLKLNA